MGVEMTLLRALAFHPRKPLPEPEVQPAQAAAPAPRQPVAPAAPPQSAPQQFAADHQPGAGGAPASCSACREQPPQKRVNRQPLPARGR